MNVQELFREAVRERPEILEELLNDVLGASFYDDVFILNEPALTGWADKWHLSSPPLVEAARETLIFWQRSPESYPRCFDGLEPLTASKEQSAIALAPARRSYWRERKQARQVARLAADIEHLTRSTAASQVTAWDLKDNYTARHSARVAEIARSVAERMSLPPEEVDEVRMAGLLHDIGKIGISDRILLAPRKLGVAEGAAMKTHPQLGHEILSSAAGSPLCEVIARVALQHHERLDGSGYPAGLKGDQIIPKARIVAVAEVIAAMSSAMPFRPALGQGAIVAELEAGRGTLYDPVVVDTYLDLIREGRPLASLACR